MDDDGYIVLFPTLTSLSYDVVIDGVTYSRDDIDFTKLRQNKLSFLHLLPLLQVLSYVYLQRDFDYSEFTVKEIRRRASKFDFKFSLETSKDAEQFSCYQTPDFEGLPTTLEELESKLTEEPSIPHLSRSFVPATDTGTGYGFVERLPDADPYELFLPLPFADPERVKVTRTRAKSVEVTSHSSPVPIPDYNPIDRESTPSKPYDRHRSRKRRGRTGKGRRQRATEKFRLKVGALQLSDYRQRVLARLGLDPHLNFSYPENDGPNSTPPLDPQPNLPAEFVARNSDVNVLVDHVITSHCQPVARSDYELKDLNTVIYSDLPAHVISRKMTYLPHTRFKRYWKFIPRVMITDDLRVLAQAKIKLAFVGPNCNRERLKSICFGVDESPSLSDHG